MIHRGALLQSFVRSSLASVGLSLLLLFAGAMKEARAESIQEARYARLGGVEQWITIRGSSRTNPVLLVLHGGPGDTQSSLVSTFAPLKATAFRRVPLADRGGVVPWI